jgi:DNA-binding PadR family transcriptional regulator
MPTRAVVRTHAPPGQTGQRADRRQPKLGWTRGRASQVFRELEQQGLVRSLERPGTRGRPRRLYEVTY